MKHVGIQGKRIRTAHLDVRTLASPLVHPRVGFVVPKYGHTAVERNRLKRQLREIVRMHLLGQLPSVDVLIRVKPSAYSALFAALVEELTRAIGPESKL